MIDENTILALVERLEVAEKEVRAQLAEKDRTIYELNCAVQEAKRERDEALAMVGMFKEKYLEAAKLWTEEQERVIQRDLRIAEFVKFIGDLFYCFSSTKMPEHWDSWYRDAGKLLSPAPAQPATAAKAR